MIDIPTTVKNKRLVERRRKQIVLAAIKLFARNGFYKTTLKDLAEEAGLSYGNIYDYVGSKEDIFFLIHDFLAGSAMEMLNRSTEQLKDPIEKLRRMVRAEFSLMDQWADALLLIYQESHILKNGFLKQLLKKERAHLEKFESVLTQAIDEGMIGECNVRLVCNLIKMMIDSWTMKRWDLRGHASQLEAEQTILGMIFHGLLKEGSLQKETFQPLSEPLRGKTALVLNAGTKIGHGICYALQKNGARVLYDAGAGKIQVLTNDDLAFEPIVLANCSKGRSHRDLLDPQRVEKRFGPIDVYVHDIGAGTTEMPGGVEAKQVAEQLRLHLYHAEQISGYFLDRMKQRRSGRIVYLAPWLWDRHADLIVFEAVKAGVVALCRTMAGELAASSATVNCIVPGYLRTNRPTQIEKALKDEVASKIPAKRLGEISDVTDTVSFLIADGSKYLTGQVLHVSGGR